MDADPTGDSAPDSGPGGAGLHHDLPANRAPRGSSSPRSIDLARRFVEQLVAEAVATRKAHGSEETDPAVDWQAIWASATAQTPERAAGRMVLTADRVARVLTGTAELVENTPMPASGHAFGTTSTPTADAPPPPFVAPPPIIAPVPPPSPRPLVTERISGSPPPPSPRAVDPPPWRATPPAFSPPAFSPPAPPSPPPLPPPAAVSTAGPVAGDDHSDISVAAVDTGRRRPGARHRRWSTAFAWVRNIALVVVLFAAWQVWGTGILEHHDQDQLARQFRLDASTTPSDDRPVGLLRSTAPVAGPPEGSVIAQIQIPAIALSQFVVQGTATGDLEKGPGHYVGTAVPGQAGNVAVAGHRTTFGAPFERLSQLKRGEPITLTTIAGETLTYAVSGPPRVVGNSDVALLHDFGDNRLTLATSDPRYSAAQRLVVVATLEPSSIRATGSDTTTAPHPGVGAPPGRLIDTQTGRWNVNRLPLAGGIAALLVLLGLSYRRPVRGRRLLTVLILGPVWIAGLALLFLALTNVLPATL